MTSLPLSFSSHSHYFPMSSVAFFDLRPPPAPPPEPPPPPTPPEPPDPQICRSFRESFRQPPIFTSFKAFDSLLQLPSAGSNFPSRASLPLLPTKALLTVGMVLPDESSFAIWYSELDTRLSPITTVLFIAAGCLSYAITFPPYLLPQVCSSLSPSNSSEMGKYWMFVEVVALDLWSLDLIHSISMGLDTLVSILVLSCTVLTALMRSFTAVCRCYLEFTLLEVLVLSCTVLTALMRSFTAVCRFYLEFTLLEVFSWQLGQISLIDYNQLVNLVHWGFHSPHLSFPEFIILPNTSLVFSVSFTGSIVFKTVLLEADARTVVQDCFRSAFADCLVLMTQEALFPPPCGFGKDFQAKDVRSIGFSWLDAILVELDSSPLSLSLNLSIVVAFSFRFYSITIWINVLNFSTLCSLVSSFRG